MIADITAILLAGGESRRMGAFDKAFLHWPPPAPSPVQAPQYQQSLLYHCLQRVQRQVHDVVVSINQSWPWSDAIGYPIVADTARFHQQGPLAGLFSAGMQSRSEWLCLLPVDMPYLPDNWVAALWAGRGQSQLVVAHDGVRQQNAVLLVHRDLLGDVESALLAGQRSIYKWLQTHTPATVYFHDCGNAFANINSPEDWQHSLM